MTYRVVRAYRVHAVALLLALTGFLLAEAGLATALTAATATATGAAAGAAGAAVLWLCALLVLASPGGPRPDRPERIRTVIRDREHRTAFLPQCDPDAAGRPRPRAPGRGLPTAV